MGNLTVDRLIIGLTYAIDQEFIPPHLAAEAQAVCDGLEHAVADGVFDRSDVVVAFV